MYSPETMALMDRALCAGRWPRVCTSCEGWLDEAPRWNCAKPSDHTAVPRPSQEAEVRPKYPDVVVELTGQDGNGFMIACRVRSALQRHLRDCGDDLEDATAEGARFFNEALSRDYGHLLETVMKWVSVE